jgi:hypothetical protein
MAPSKCVSYWTWAETLAKTSGRLRETGGW